LEGIVQQCLKECNTRGISTVAFPALGAGIHRYPPEVVAKVMITTVQNYYLSIATTCIQEVKIVVFKDNERKIFESFLSQNPDSYTPRKLPITSPPQDIQNSPYMAQSQDVHNSPSMSALHIPPPPQSICTSPVSSHSLSSVCEPAQPLSHCRTFKTGDIKVQIMCGDITDDASDVIVNTTLFDLQLRTGPGTVSNAILQKAGPSMQQSCSVYIKQHKQLEEGKVCITEATGQLRCKMVFHIVASNSKKANALFRSITTCLNEAENNKLNSIAFPAIGTGGLSYKPIVAAQGICEAIIKFSQTHPEHLKQARIVIFQQSMYQVFVQKYTELSTEQIRFPKPKIFTQCFSAMTTTRSAVSMSTHKTTKANPVLSSIAQIPTVEIKVYAKCPKAVREAEESLMSIIDQEFGPFSVDHPYVSNLKPKQISQLTQEAAKLNLTIHVETENSQIKIRGRKDNVQQLKDIINEMLHEIEKVAIKAEADERETQLEKQVSKAKVLIQTKVRWQYQSCESQYKDYDTDTNYDIEQAYQLYKKENSASIFTDTKNWSQHVQRKIYFDRNPMQEEDCTTGNKINIQRIDIEG